MRKVTMARAIRLPSGFVHPGDVVEVDDATFDRLLERGTIVDESAKPEPKEPEPEAEPAPKPEPEAEEKPAPSKRPEKYASVAVWKAYASSLGLKISGLTKAELIGAVDALES